MLTLFLDYGRRLPTIQSILFFTIPFRSHINVVVASLRSSRILSQYKHYILCIFSQIYLHFFCLWTQRASQNVKANMYRTSQLSNALRIYMIMNGKQFHIVFVMSAIMSKGFDRFWSLFISLKINIFQYYFDHFYLAFVPVSAIFRVIEWRKKSLGKWQALFTNSSV